MKIYLFIVLFCGCVASAASQTFEEWFRQKKTQKKYLLEQIAAFRNYMTTMNKGYTIVRNGSRLIHDVKAQDSTQHRQYIQSLSDVNPAIRQSKTVAHIIRLQQQVLQVAQHALNHTGCTAILTPTEAAYLKSVFDNLLSRSFQSLEELQALLTNGKYQLKDNERIKRINQVYADVQVQYSFAVSFRQEASVLELRREQEKNALQHRKAINGLP